MDNLPILPIVAYDKEFLQAISHDIRANFFGFSSLCVLLREACNAREDTDILFDHLMEANQRYKFKLNNFIELLASQLKFSEEPTEEVNLRKLVDKVLRDNEHLSRIRATRVHLQILQDMPVCVPGDEFKIGQIFSNLLNNALSYSAQGETVYVDIHRKSVTTWQMDIKDNGAGMTQEEQNCLFNPSLPDRKSLKNPRGIGLLVTKSLVSALGARLHISSQPDVGTTCSILFPLIG